MNDIQVLEDMRDEINGWLWDEDDYKMRAEAQQQFDALNWAIKKLKEKKLEVNIYRLESALSGQGIAYYLQERAKNPNIIYLTNDTIMDTDTVKKLANYIEGLEFVCMNLNDNYISKQVIRDKINEIEKSNLVVNCAARSCGKTAAQYYQIGELAVLKELLGEENA